MEKGEPCRLFGALLGSLGAVGSLLGHFLEPLGHLGHQKSPTGAPKAPKGLPEVTKKMHIFDQKLDLCEFTGFPKNVKKKRLKNTKKKTHTNHSINVPQV